MVVMAKHIRNLAKEATQSAWFKKALGLKLLRLLTEPILNHKSMTDGLIPWIAKPGTPGTETEFFWMNGLEIRSSWICEFPSKMQEMQLAYFHSARTRLCSFWANTSSALRWSRSNTKAWLLAFARLTDLQLLQLLRCSEFSIWTYQDQIRSQCLKALRLWHFGHSLTTVLRSFHQISSGGHLSQALAWWASGPCKAPRRPNWLRMI